MVNFLVYSKEYIAEAFVKFCAYLTQFNQLHECDTVIALIIFMVE